MVLEKNDNLILNICKVLIRSTDNVVDIPSLQKVYHTPSQITFGTNTAHTENGNLVDKSLRLSYPGLGATDFLKFDQLTKGAYQVYIELDNGELYEVATSKFPMGCSTGFDIDRGHELIFSSRSPSTMVYKGNSGGDPVELEEMFDYDFDFNLG